MPCLSRLCSLDISSLINDAGAWISVIGLIIQSYNYWNSETTPTALESVKFDDVSTPCLIFTLWNSSSNQRLHELPKHFQITDESSKALKYSQFR